MPLDQPTEDLFQAVMHGDAAGVRQALAAGADPNASSGGAYPLHFAAMEDNTEIIEALIAADANINKEDDCCRTPLYSALMNAEATPILRILLAHGADPDIADIDGYTPLDHAVMEETDVEAIRTLAQAGAQCRREHRHLVERITKSQDRTP